ncbi:TPA: replication endonuclease [Yersinia enterocolitica]|nr:replication endonuclease [Yersinia enterocolitica]EKN4753649.1 replication endonuclease [Yersinia enterocolitica]EKN4904718.1 replication endonuclease [Yersinia enterocolitica]HEN3452011.1 replication endonuclease [Yersinia enterocolitica]
MSRVRFINLEVPENINSVRGRITPTPPLPYPGSGAAVTQWSYPWNAPRPAISGPERSLTREQLIQGQAVLEKINNLPHFLRDQFISRHTFLLANKGLHAANKWLIFVFEQRIWPRLHVVNTKNSMDTKYLREFSLEPEDYDKLPGLHNKELRRLARQISDELMMFFDHYCDQCVATNQGDRSILLTLGTQMRVFGKLGRFARAFHVTPMHWRKYLKGRLDITSAIASLSRLVNPEWWERKLKAQRTRWREALLIAVGNVSRDMSASSYASKQAIREVFARRQSNLEYLKSCQLENIETGERIDLIDKVMASISNPEIRRMELMNTIAFTEKYAAGQKHVGMFLTITTPSKYHPTRVVGKGDNEKVQLNHKWNDEAYSPKDGQRYLCKIWSKMRTAFKDNELSVYGMRVVEPHHDGTPHWHMMLFCQRRQRQQVIDIMRRYALKEDGDERGAAKYRFECKHMNKGGAAGYIAKYIAKNIDGYALEGERDHETGELLTDSAAAVTAWAATWRIPQFRPIGLPSMGVYRECRRIRSISLAETFDETVEAVRHAADEGDFAAYIAAQGGTNCGNQTVRLAKRVADELNAYDEEVQKVVGIYAPHLGADHIHETRTTQWRIVAGAVDVELLTLKSASGAPRSPVNNCGLGGNTQAPNDPNGQAKTPVMAMEYPPDAVIDWSDTAAVRAMVARVKEKQPTISKMQRSYDPTKGRLIAPSARLTREERQRIPQIRNDLLLKDISVQRWELESLARGASMTFDDTVIQYPALSDWPEFDD